MALKQEITNRSKTTELGVMKLQLAQSLLATAPSCRAATTGEDYGRVLWRMWPTLHGEPPLMERGIELLKMLEKILQTLAPMDCINYCAPGSYTTACWHLSV